MYPGWYFCLVEKGNVVLHSYHEIGFWEHILGSEDAICWTWQRSSLVPENSCFLETQSSYQRCGGLGDFGSKVWLWKRSGRCGWRRSMALDRGKKTRRVNTQDWNGRESYKGTKRASPPLQEVVITWQSMTGASHCSLSFPGKMSSLPPFFHTLRLQPWNIVNQSHLLIILSYSPMIGSHSLVPAKLLTRWWAAAAEALSIIESRFLVPGEGVHKAEQEIGFPTWIRICTDFQTAHKVFLLQSSLIFLASSQFQAFCQPESCCLPLLYLANRWAPAACKICWPSN